MNQLQSYEWCQLTSERDNIKLDLDGGKTYWFKEEVRRASNRLRELDNKIKELEKES